MLAKRTLPSSVELSHKLSCFRPTHVFFFFSSYTDHISSPRKSYHILSSSNLITGYACLFPFVASSLSLGESNMYVLLSEAMCAKVRENTWANKLLYEPVPEAPYKEANMNTQLIICSNMFLYFTYHLDRQKLVICW